MIVTEDDIGMIIRDTRWNYEKFVMIAGLTDKKGFTPVIRTFTMEDQLVVDAYHTTCIGVPTVVRVGKAMWLRHLGVIMMIHKTYVKDPDAPYYYKPI